MTRVSPLALLIALAVGSCARQVDEPVTTSTPATTKATPSIDWRDWDAAVFEQARRDGSLIVIDVGIEGCTACRWMDELTYRDPAVAGRIAEHFVAIAVDAEARPDIGERYSEWGWPATIFMTPGAEQVLAIRGNKLPRNFIPILDEMIEAHRAGTLAADGSTPLSIPPNPDPAELGMLRRRVVDQLDRLYDAEGGGWGRRQKLPLGPNVAHALLRAHTRERQPWEPRALHTLEQYSNLLDPVWGGVFVGAIGHAGAHHPREAHRRTGQRNGRLRPSPSADRRPRLAGPGPRRRSLCRSIHALPGGGFHTSQEDDAPDLPDGLDAHAYYTTLDDAGRRAYGLPAGRSRDLHRQERADESPPTSISSRPAETRRHSTGARGAARLLLPRQGEDGLFDQHDRTQPLGDDRMRSLPGGTRRYLQPQGPMGWRSSTSTGSPLNPAGCAAPRPSLRASTHWRIPSMEDGSRSTTTPRLR